MDGRVNKAADLDVIVVGAGFSGLHILHELVKRNYRVHLFDDGEGPGGTWDKNHYPGARVDSEVWVYQYTDPAIWENYCFTEKFPGWRELKSYFEYVVKQWGIGPHITFKTRVEESTFDEASAVWKVRTSDGKTKTARYLVFATGSTTKPIIPYFAGAETFKGQSYHTARWPREGASMKGKRVAVVGTGASGVQVIQEASREADHLTVFQRTPNLALPMGQEKYTREEYDKLKATFPPVMERIKQTFAGFAYDLNFKPWKMMSEEERHNVMRRNWNRKGFNFWLAAPMDLFFDEECNRAHYNFWRDETRKRIKKESLIELLAPTEPPHPWGTKRPCLEQWYFEAYHQDNVDLVNVSANPIERITEKGIVAGGKEHEVDMIAYALGFDTCTGAISAVDIRSAAGRTIGDLWKEQSLSYLGKAIPGYPNLLYTYALQSPSAFLNGPVAAELEGDWIVKVLEDMDKSGIRRFEAERNAAELWGKRCYELGDASLFVKAKSWYMAANVPGKRPEIQPFIGGQVAYRTALYDESENGYLNFVLSKHAETMPAE
jgi:cation diffusion facilitator CzcD-associated flavoprotein CzcO